MRAVTAGAALVSLALGSAAAAQVPPEIAAKVHASCGKIDFSVMQAYGPLQPKEPYTGVEVTRDVSYGPDPLQKLDVFDPQRSAPQRDDQRLAKATRRPVLIFVHGGGFTRG